MICAYDKTYLSRAQTALGRMLDFAIHDLGYGLAEFFALFLSLDLKQEILLFLFFSLKFLFQLTNSFSAYFIKP